MNNYYNMLAESLTKKYSGKLNEAWGNVPSWMKPRLTGLAHTHDRNRWDKDMMPNRKFDSGYDYADYAKPRGGYRGKDLYTAIGESGVDLLNATYIEGDPPRSTKDPRILPPNIPIWHFPNSSYSTFGRGAGDGQVYIKGVNDLEKLDSSTDYDSKNYAGKTFGSLPLKTMADMCDHFAYIDGTTLSQQKDTRWDKINKRKEYERWEDDNPSLVRDKEEASTNGYDKSGYMIIPPAKKYADELKKRGLRKYAEKLEKVEEQLNYYFDEIVESSYANMRGGGIDSIQRDSLSSAKNYLGYANGLYKGILGGIENLVNSYGYVRDSDEFLNHLDDWPVEFSRKLSDINDYIRYLKNELNNSGYSALDF